MRYANFIILPLLVVVSGCNNEDSNSDNLTEKENELLKKELELAKKELELKEKEEAIPKPEKIEDEPAKSNDPIELIRDRYTNINSSIDSYTKKVDPDINVYKDINPDSYSYESVGIYRLAMIRLERFYDGGKLRKSVVTFDAQGETLVSEYYYWDGAVFFVFKRHSIYDENKSSDDFNENNKNVKENRYYFADDKLIRWVNENKTHVDLSKNNTTSIEKEVLSDSRLYKRIK